MPGARKNSMGLDGFIWFIGVIEDRKDPEMLGRVRVRCFGWHTDDKKRIPTEALPWAHPVIPVNSPASYVAKEGDYVFGFFMDGNSAQNPCVVGVMPGKPGTRPDYELGFSDPNKKYPEERKINEQTNSRLARGRIDGTVIETKKRGLKKSIKSAKGITWSEPSPSFAPVYPYNNAHESESGHAFELDDSTGKERVHLAHKTGTAIEMRPDGSRVDKIVKDNYTVVMGDDYVYVSGKCNITVDGDCNLKVNGDLNIEAKEINMAASGDVNILGKSVNIESKGDMDLKAAKAFTAGGRTTASLQGRTTVAIGAAIAMVGSLVQLEVDGTNSPSGSGLKTPEDGKSAGPLSAIASTVSGALGTVATKTLGSGLTESLGGINTVINGNLDAGLGALAKNIPTDSIQSQMMGFETALNDAAGQVPGLDSISKSTVYSKATALTNGCIEKGIDLNLHENYIAPVSLVDTKTYAVAKQLWPQTDFLPIPTGE